MPSSGGSCSRVTLTSGRLVARTGAMMGRRTFDVVDLTELFVHWEAGRSQVQIGESLNLDRKTVRKFLAPALAEGLVPCGPPAGELVWAQRIGRWFPGLSDARLRQVTCRRSRRTGTTSSSNGRTRSPSRRSAPG